jgi:hypothetical protein
VANLLAKVKPKRRPGPEKGMRSVDRAVGSGTKPDRNPEAATGGWRWNGGKV